MGDDPDWWTSAISDEEWQLRVEEARQRRAKAHEAWEAAKAEEAAVYQMRIKQVRGDYDKRNWAVWKRYRAGGVTLQQVGKEFGVTGSRIRDIVVKCDRKVKRGLNYDWNNVPDEIRENTLGVEFVFQNELTFGPEETLKEWNRLEPDEYGSAYSGPVPEWLPDWVEQDTKPAKPRKVYTYYKFVVEKEQTND